MLSCLVCFSKPPFLIVSVCLAVLQASVFATNEIQTFELGGTVNLTCGNLRNLSSATVLSWSKDQRVLLNITSSNSTLVLPNLSVSGSGLYVCTANASIILRRVRLSVRTIRGTVPVQEEEVIPQERLTKVDIIAIIVGLGLTTFLTVSMALLLYRAEMRRRETKYSNRWKVSVKSGQENMALEEEFPPLSKAYYQRNGQEPNRPPPPYRKPMDYGMENSGWKYEVDGNANNNNNNNSSNNDEGIRQWRFTAYL